MVEVLRAFGPEQFVITRAKAKEGALQAAILDSASEQQRL